MTVHPCLAITAEIPGCPLLPGAGGRGGVRGGAGGPLRAAAGAGGGALLRGDQQTRVPGLGRVPRQHRGHGVSSTH